MNHTGPFIITGRRSRCLFGSKITPFSRMTNAVNDIGTTTTTEKLSSKDPGLVHYCSITMLLMLVIMLPTNEVSAGCNDLHQAFTRFVAFLSWLRLAVYMSIVSVAIIINFHLKSEPTATGKYFLCTVI